MMSMESLPLVFCKKSSQIWAAKSSLIIPRRKDEGYGLTINVLKRGLDKKEVSLVIALDCGTNSVEEATFLKDKGIDLIVVDHHQAKEDVSSFPIILNPHLFDSPDAPGVPFAPQD
jgi:single-stranded-DNA-specific exonuclease